MEVDPKASRCPHCQGDLRSWHNRHPIFTILLVLVILSQLANVYFASNKTGSKTQRKNNLPLTADEIKTNTAQREQTIGTLAGSFCASRQGKYSSGIFFCSACVDLGEIVDDNVTTVHNAKAPATQENCQKAAQLCLNHWDTKECSNIAQKKIWMGMSKDQLLMSWGVPSSQNDTVGSWGIHTQWVYRSSGQYVYLEGESKDKLTVTSWQSSR